MSASPEASWSAQMEGKREAQVEGLALGGVFQEAPHQGHSVEVAHRAHTGTAGFDSGGQVVILPQLHRVAACGLDGFDAVGFLDHLCQGGALVGLAMDQEDFFQAFDDGAHPLD